MLDEARRKLSELAPSLAVQRTTTLEAVFGQALGPARQLMSVLAFLTSLAVVLGAVGVYGVTSHFVRRRQRDIGIKEFALGLRPAKVIAEVVRRGGALVLVGSALGVGAALALAHLLSAFLYVLSPSLRGDRRRPVVARRRERGPARRRGRRRAPPGLARESARPGRPVPRRLTALPPRSSRAAPPPPDLRLPARHLRGAGAPLRRPHRPPPRRGRVRDAGPARARGGDLARGRDRRGLRHARIGSRRRGWSRRSAATPGPEARGGCSRSRREGARALAESQRCASGSGAASISSRCSGGHAAEPARRCARVHRVIVSTRDRSTDRAHPRPLLVIGPPATAAGPNR